MTKVTGKGLVSDTEFVVRYSELLEEILGFGITKNYRLKESFSIKAVINSPITSNTERFITAANVKRCWLN